MSNFCDPDRTFYPGMNGGTGCFRFTDKDTNEHERELTNNWWKELIGLYGQEVDYYVHTYNTLSADNFYGEQPTQEYHTPKKVIIAIELEENAVNLSQFGFVSDDEITAYIHIETFVETFSGDSVHPDNLQTLEPKSGDLFKLTEYGSTRPGNRDGKIFEITERLDQDINQINFLAGHYVWLVKAKRFEPSFEPGITPEKGTDQVYESSFAGRLSGGENPKTDDKAYEGDVNEDSRKNVFDMSDNDTDIYGNYY